MRHSSYQPDPSDPAVRSAAIGKPMKEGILSTDYADYTDYGFGGKKTREIGGIGVICGLKEEDEERRKQE